MFAESQVEQVSFHLNGKFVSIETGLETNLLEVLRNQFDITSPQNGCSPLGQCGCCVVLIDGKAMVSCVVPVSKVIGKSVITLEGFTKQKREIWSHAFMAKAGLQCGFCIPGIVVRGESLLSQNPNPTREEIAKSLNQHICRCTGFVKIVDAIETD